jgi:hypothetical protein
VTASVRSSRAPAPPALIVGAIGEVAVAVITLGMVLLADRWFHLG